MKNYNWGIIAPGNIARQFSIALRGTERATLYSVASRNQDRAAAFADEFGFQTVAKDYRALINDPLVDIIYIASTHPHHYSQSLLCLNAGKPVLCEKPMTVNLNQAQEVIEAAKHNNVFFMEAVWTRFMPVYQKIRQWLDNGHIGEIHMVDASFAFHKALDPNSRLYNADQAGGATLDLGIYPITFAQWVFNEATPQVKAVGHIGHTNVDEKTAILLKYPSGNIANLQCAITAETTQEAHIYGTEGRITIPQFWHPESATLTKNGCIQDIDTVSMPHRINGYEGEIEEVQHCLDAGLIESHTYSWQSSLTVMKIMDEVRDQLGLIYPFEKATE